MERVGLVVYDMISITQPCVVSLLTGFLRYFREFVIASAYQRRQTVFDKLVMDSTGDRSRWVHAEMLREDHKLEIRGQARPWVEGAIRYRIHDCD
jgi:hypothetical protein